MTPLAHRDRRRWHRRPSVSGDRRRARAAGAPSRRRRHVRGHSARHRGAGGAARGLRARPVAQRGLEGHVDCGLARGVALLPLSALDAWRHLSRRQPSLVIGVGGYSSGPVVLLAALRGIPTLLLEQNAVPGLTNRLLARVVGCGGGDVRIDGVVLRQEGICRRQPGSSGVLCNRLDVSTRRDRRAAHEGSDLWRLPGRARDQHGHGGGSAAAGSRWRRGRSRIKQESAIWTWSGDAYRDAGLEARVEPFLFTMDREMKAGRRDRLPRRGDDDRGAHGGRTRGDSDPAADGGRRSPAQERGGAGRRQGAAELIEQKDLTGELLAARLLGARRAIRNGVAPIAAAAQTVCASRTRPR